MRGRVKAKSTRRAGRAATTPVKSRPASALRVTGDATPVPLEGLPLDADERAILVLCCTQHVVACPSCRNTVRLGWLGSMGRAQYPCPLCAADLAPVVVAHTRICTYFTTRAERKPPVRVERAAREPEAAAG